MNYGKLPLKLQIAIRDYWLSDTAAVQKARATLRKAIGCPVHIEPEWQQLLSALDKVYPDRQDLATAVARCVECWCTVFRQLLQGADDVGADETQRKWADKLMESLDLSIGLRLTVGVADAAQGTYPGTVWCEDEAVFYLYLPSDEPAVASVETALLYFDGLRVCFDAKKPKATLIDKKAARDAGRDDWADMEVDTATGTATVVGTTEAAHSSLLMRPAPTVEYLPSVDSLMRPDELFLRPPYHLIVRELGVQKVVVQGSHSPSLALVGKYFQKWCRTNHKNAQRPPAVEVTYNQSCWGSGMMYDQVTLDAEDDNVFFFNAAVVLAFVEGVLGYSLVHAGPAVWTYRRTEAFKVQQ